MALSNELVSQFAKIAKDNDNDKTKRGDTVYGTFVESNGKKYVRIDGSDLLTPVTTTTTNVEPDERVTVNIKNHSAIVTGNISSPSARTDEVTSVGSKVTAFEIAVGGKVDAIEVIAEELKAKDANIYGMLLANDADIQNLQADNVTIKDTLTVNNADITNLKAVDAEITGKLTAVDADIESLQADTLTVTESLNAVKADIVELEAHDVTVTGELTAVKADIDHINANKLNVDFANIDQAAFEYFYAESGLIRDVVVDNGSITGHLVGVTISGDLIEGNTIKADKLVIRGNDGLYYKLNVNENGARNLIKDSGNEQSSSEYIVGCYTPTEYLVEGETYTLSLDVTPASGVNRMEMYTSEGWQYLCGIDINGTERQTVTVTFNASYYDGRTPTDDTTFGKIYAYRLPNDGTVTGITTIHAVKCEKGSIATEWTPAPEDNTYFEGLTYEDLNSGLHGSKIIAKTITAEKVNVSDLVAFDATIGGFHITDHSIYSGVKASADNDIRGLYMDDEGQIALGDDTNYLKFYQDEDGTYKLNLSADTMIFSSSQRNVEEVVEEVSSDAAAAKSTSESNSTKIVETESSIIKLNESISMLIRGENGESLMTQTEDGWIFSLATILGTLNTATSNISVLTTDMNTANGEIDSLNQSVTDLSEYTDYIKFGTDNGQPCIILGETDSAFKVLITNTDIRFMEGSAIPASISNQSLNIEKAVIQDELKQGGFVWMARDNGNYGLIWKGE